MKTGIALAQALCKCREVEYCDVGLTRYRLLLNEFLDFAFEFSIVFLSNLNIY